MVCFVAYSKLIFLPFCKVCKLLSGAGWDTVPRKVFVVDLLPRQHRLQPQAAGRRPRGRARRVRREEVAVPSSWDRGHPAAAVTIAFTGQWTTAIFSFTHSGKS